MSDPSNDEKASKEAKLSEAVSNESVCESLTSFQGLTWTRVLSENPENKVIVVQGTFPSSIEGKDPEPAIVLLEKSHLTETDTLALMSDPETLLEKVFCNDIYGNFFCLPPPRLNPIKATVIHPATEKHLAKYSTRCAVIIEETPVIYQSITLPHIEKSQLNTQWVYNILEKKKEVDRVIYDDPDPETGFVLLPDLKWDCKSTTNLYLTAIVVPRNIKSLRDLTSKHLPLLRNIIDKGSAAIDKRYGLPRSQLRIYVHYQPSYYHLHVHFTSVHFKPPGCSTERAHLLSTIINNLTLNDSYYRDSTLSFVAFEGDPILEKMNCFATTSEPIN